MRTENKIVTYAKYNELTEAQKLKVLEKLQDLNVDFQWWDSTYEYIKTQLGLLGFSDIEIQFSGFWSQGDGASFTASFKVPNKKELKERIAALKEYSPDQNLFGFESLNFPKDWHGIDCKIFRIDHMYSHYNTISSDHSGLKEFAREFSKGIYKRLEKEYEYRTSREAIEEAIEANDCEFNLETLKLA